MEAFEDNIFLKDNFDIGVWLFFGGGGGVEKELETGSRFGHFLPINAVQISRIKKI